MNKAIRNEIEGDALRLLSQLERWLKLEAADKMTVLMTCVIVSAVMFALAASAVFFISMGVMKTIALATGDEMVSCYIVGVALLLLAGMFFLLRKPLVENRVVESISAQMFEGDDDEKGGEP